MGCWGVQKVSYHCIVNLKTFSFMARTITRIRRGAYKVTDAQGTFIVKNNGGLWTAYDCDDIYDCSDENNWAVAFKTKRDLLNYSSK